MVSMTISIKFTILVALDNRKARQLHLILTIFYLFFSIYCLRGSHYLLTIHSNEFVSSVTL